MTLAAVNCRTISPTVSLTGLQLPDRWYLDFICRRQPNHTKPYLYGIQALSGQNVTVYILSSGVCHSAWYNTRIRWLVGDEGVDYVGHGSGIALLLGGYRFGVAPRCNLVSVNVYNNSGLIQPDLYEDGVNAILEDHATLNNKTSIVVTSALREPKYGEFLVQHDLDRATRKLIDAGIIVVSSAGDGLRDSLTDECKGPMLASACSPNQLEDMFVVSSIDIDGHFPLFANYGDSVTAFAPGVDIGTLDKNGSFIVASSTRLSAALVGGIFALYLEKFPYASIHDLQVFVADHFLLNGNTDPYPLDRLQKDLFMGEDLGHFRLVDDSGALFPYLTNTQTKFLLAHVFFTKVLLNMTTLSLGQVLANTQFELELNAKLKNLYDEDKPCLYELIDVQPNSIGQFNIGETTGKLFGVIGDIDSPQTIILTISISDGLHQYRDNFSLYVQPNYVERQVIGGTLKGSLTNVVGLDIDEPFTSKILSIKAVMPLPTTKYVPIFREVLLYKNAQTTNLQLQSLYLKTTTNENTGAFSFEVAPGSYNAIVLDPNNQYDAYQLSNLKANSA